MFYEILKSLCDSSGTTVTAVLKKLNISTSKGTAWKNGSIPNGSSLIKIADEFNCSVDYLLGRIESPTNRGYNNMVSVGKISGNSGIVGNIVDSKISSSSLQDEQERTVLTIFRALDIVGKSRLIAFGADILKENSLEKQINKSDGGQAND